MQILSKLLFFVPNFMTRYTTVWGGNIYLPDGWKKKGNIARTAVIAHEGIHLHDRRILGKYLFNFLYLCPQILALFALLALGGNLWWLLCLLFLLPIPSVTRSLLEIRGYRMTMAILYWLKGPGSINFAVVERAFTSSSYYYMLPIPWLARKWIMWEYRKIRKDNLSDEEKQIKRIIESCLTEA
jgi:hypothetical protein